MSRRRRAVHHWYDYRRSREPTRGRYPSVNVHSNVDLAAVAERLAVELGECDSEGADPPAPVELDIAVAHKLLTNPWILPEHTRFGFAKRLLRRFLLPALHRQQHLDETLTASVALLADEVESLRRRVGALEMDLDAARRNDVT
jgi:hypothetical protein